MRRCKYYEVTTYNYDTGRTLTHVNAFNSIQAKEVGGRIYPDGLAMAKAKKLIDKWNDLGALHDRIKYHHQLKPEHGREQIHQG